MQPLQFSLAEPAQAQISDAVDYISARGQEAAEHFSARLAEEINATCLRVAQEIAEHGRAFDAPHEAASLYFSQPVYLIRVETAKRRARRSSAGLWYLFYVLQDRSGKGSPDTLNVLRVQHSAAAPFTIESSDGDDEES